MKVAKRIFVILLIGIFAVAVLPWFVFPVMNDIKANILKQELQNAPLPQSTKIVEALSGCGNTSGTGDHTEIWAGILIKTDLSEEEIYQFYGENILKVDDSKKETFIMVLIDKEFSRLNNIPDYNGYYIIERVDNVVSSYFDIRGC